MQQKLQNNLVRGLDLKIPNANTMVYYGLIFDFNQIL